MQTQWAYHRYLLAYAVRGAQPELLVYIWSSISRNIRFLIITLLQVTFRFIFIPVVQLKSSIMHLNEVSSLHLSLSKWCIIFVTHSCLGFIMCELLQMLSCKISEDLSVMSKFFNDLYMQIFRVSNNCHDFELFRHNSLRRWLFSTSSLLSNMNRYLVAIRWIDKKSLAFRIMLSLLLSLMYSTSRTSRTSIQAPSFLGLITAL